MNVGILGLGLIGGSLARAYKKAGNNVYVHDTDNNMLTFAQLAGVVDEPLDKNNLKTCDLVLLAIYADAAANWLEEKCPLYCQERTGNRLLWHKSGSLQTLFSIG